MRIAICDDDARELTQLSAIMDAYRQEKKVGFAYKTFSNASALLEEVHRGGFDLVLLDVLMPIVNGMQAAHEIRRFDETVKIIFLTSSSEFALESYAVKAYTYLLKPATKESLFPILDKLFYDMQNPEDSLMVKFQSGIASLLFSKIAYVEVLNKKLYFHLVDSSTRELVASLSNFEEILLSRSEFIKVHRAFIVNMWQIQELYQASIITHMGKTIPVSRRLYPQVKETYMKHLFLEKGVK